jgi:hypothetical protein
MPSMPNAEQPGHTGTSDDTVILGVDTHKDTHVAAVISAQGTLLGHRSFPATAAGYQQLLDWAQTGPILTICVLTCFLAPAAAALTPQSRHFSSRGRVPNP